MKKLFSAAGLIGLVASAAVVLGPQTAQAAIPDVDIDAACKAADPTLVGSGTLVYSQNYEVYTGYSVTDARMTFGDQSCEVLYAEGTLPSDIEVEHVSYTWELYGDLEVAGNPQGNMSRRTIVCEDGTTDDGTQVKCALPADGEVFLASTHGDTFVDGPFVWTDFTEVKWDFNIVGKEHTGVIVTPTDEEIAAADATRDAAVAAATATANTKVKAAKTTATKQIKAVKKATANKIKKVKQSNKAPAVKKKAIKKLNKAKAAKVKKITKAKNAKILSANKAKAVKIKQANDAYTAASTPHEQLNDVNATASASRAV